MAFDRPHAVVDSNVKRVLARLLTIEAPANQAASGKLFQAQADRLLHHRRPGDFNQALMELGALVCTPLSPQCTACPLTRFCVAHREGTVAQYPRRAASRPVPEVETAVGVVLKHGRLLITQRPANGLLGGLWEFPGGKLRENERPEDACVREIKEEVNLDVFIERPIAQVRHAYSHFRIHMHVFVCRFVAGRVRLRGPVDHRWIRLNEIDRFAFPKANHKFIPLLK
jgi:A/G-specific adenine glycosylase